MRNAFIATLTELAQDNPAIWLLCGDLGYSVLEPFAERFPDRYVNIGVAEQNMAGVAAGLALSGNTVFVYSIGNFPTLRCLEQIRNDICYHGADVKIVSVGGGFAYGSQGYTHHAIEDVAIMAMLPGMEVFVPCDPAEARLATHSIAHNKQPSYLRLSRAGEPVLGDPSAIDIKRARVLRAGREVVIITTGPIASACLEAAEILRINSELDVGVIAIARLKPFDNTLLQQLDETNRLIVTVEEHILRGGLHAAVAAELAQAPRHSPLLGLGIPEAAGKISKAGDRDALLAAAGLSAKGIAERITATLPNTS